MFNVSLKGQEGINIKFTINRVEKPACQPARPTGMCNVKQKSKGKIYKCFFTRATSPAQRIGTERP